MKNYIVYASEEDRSNAAPFGELTESAIIERAKQGEIGPDFILIHSGYLTNTEIRAKDLPGFPTKTLGVPTSKEDTRIRGANEMPSVSSASQMNRYRDAYLVATVTAGIGGAVKAIGIGLGGFIVILAAIMGSQNGDSSQFIVGGLLLGVIVGIPIYVLGVLVSAHAQVLKATLDTAVHSSPFLTKEEMSRVMSV